MDVNALSGDQRAPALHWATCKGHVQVCALLLEAGADWLIPDVQGYNALHVAAQNGQDMVMRLLLAHSPNVDINSRDASGRTPLLWAAYRGNVEVVGMLLEHKNEINLDAVDGDGRGPLHWAVIKGHSVVAARLLKAGASLDLVDKEGKKPADWAKVKEVSWFPRLHQITLDYRRNPQLSGEQATPAEEFGTKVVPMFIIPLLVGSYVYFEKWWLGTAVGSVAVFLLHNVVQRGLLPPGRSLPASPYLTSFNLGTLAVFTFTGVAWLLNPLNWAWSLVWMVGTCVAVGALIQLRSQDPGRLALTRDDKSRRALICDLAKRGLLTKRSFCTTCQIRKPLRSKHCQTCDRCVARFDHHCPWINNCVGNHNHRTFMIYLFACLVMAVSHIVLSWNYLAREDSKASFLQVLKQGASNAPAVFWLTIFAAVSGSLIACLAALQSYQILRNLTTNEVSNSARLEYFHLSGSYQNPFDLGFVRNWKDFWQHPLKRAHNYIRLFEVEITKESKCTGKGCCEPKSFMKRSCPTREHLQPHNQPDHSRQRLLQQE